MDDPLRIPAAAFAAMADHARRCAPRECCGLLAGSGAVVDVLHELVNEDDRPDRFLASVGLIAPLRAIRESGRRLLAIYHSHPHRPAVPSGRDVAGNHYGAVVHAIVGAGGVRWWRLAPGVTEVTVTTTDGPLLTHAAVATPPATRHPEEADMQRTLVLLKPDAVARRLVGEIVGRFERKGLWIVGMKHMTMSREIAQAHYAEHKDKPFFADLAAFMTSSPLVALVLEGPDAIPLVRKLVGKTKVHDAEPGTIRGDLALSTQQNLIHASDSEESAARELDIWFPGGDGLSDYQPVDGKWVTETLA